VQSELGKMGTGEEWTEICSHLYKLEQVIRRVYVLKFNGDIAASQEKNLREEVTAILKQADPGRSDCVVVRLNSSGGTVTGYGHAAAQIVRLKNAGINVVVCIYEVATSGGYMMAVVAHKIYASRSAALGGIGVIATEPNIRKSLKRDGMLAQKEKNGHAFQEDKRQSLERTSFEVFKM
jgi:ClpP class serine protease